MVKHLVVALIAAGLLTACGKKEPVKSAEEQKAEKDAATKAVRDNPVYGDQFKALDKAKATAAKAEEAAKKTQDAIDAAEKK